MFYVKALFPVLLAINLMFAGLVFAILKNDRSARHWIIGCLLGSAGFGLILMRDIWPFSLTFLLSNFLIIVSWFFFATAIEVLLKGSSRLLMWAPPIGLIYTAGLALIQNSDSKYLIPIHVGVSWALVRSEEHTSELQSH